MPAGRSSLSWERHVGVGLALGLYAGAFLSQKPAASRHLFPAKALGRAQPELSRATRYQWPAQQSGILWG